MWFVEAKMKRLTPALFASCNAFQVPVTLALITSSKEAFGFPTPAKWITCVQPSNTPYTDDLSLKSQTLSILHSLSTKFDCENGVSRSILTISYPYALKPLRRTVPMTPLHPVNAIFIATLLVNKNIQYSLIKYWTKSILDK